jgi:diguanylate cyclase (GGDEF)-like protein/PAS domain S-box-containing protein
MKKKVVPELFYKELMDNLYDGVYFVDTDRQITYWNKGAERITGYQAEKMIGSFCFDNLLNHVTETGKHLCQDGCPLSTALQNGKVIKAEVFLRHKDGHRVPVTVRVAPIQDKNHRIIGAVETFSNNQANIQLRRKVDQLKQSILQDPLTGIGNRVHCETKLKSAIMEYHQHGYPFGLLFLDIDHFKVINDTNGHEVGDQALKSLAGTLSSNLRNADTCDRWGGDEFIVILADTDATALLRVAEKLRTMIEHSTFMVEDCEVTITASIGATLVREGDTMKALIKRADAFMYQSKFNGRNCVTMG